MMDFCIDYYEKLGVEILVLDVLPQTGAQAQFLGYLVLVGLALPPVQNLLGVGGGGSAAWIRSKVTCGYWKGGIGCAIVVLRLPPGRPGADMERQ